jgi:pSer/pThr/pTyr-binding forkhead associated (FHA) protein
MASSLTATKTFSVSAEDRAALDAALLKKYPLVLVPVETPEKRLKITRVSNLTGRNPACDLAISHPSISRQHCLLQLTERGLHVKDLDTTNGTRVNGIALKEGYISPGDKLTIGHVHFMVEKD